MDKIKYVKLEQPDGSYSESIPLSVEAQYVTLTDGDSIEDKINKKVYYYNNIENMKADTKLKVGDMAVTLGYYEVNDGGGAKYKIVNTVSQTEYQEIVGSLYATLIIDNNTNVKQFGVKADGVVDDTSNIINYVNTCIDLGIPINLTEGIYKVTQSIRINQYNKINIIGNVVIKTTANIGIKIDNISVDESITDNRLLNSEVINTKNGNLVIIGNGTNIGVTMGTDSNQSTSYLNSYAYVNIGNIKVQNFNIGLLLYLNRLYINSFDNLVIKNCKTAVSTSNYTFDSSENILFNHCVFAGCETCIDYKQLPVDLFFNNCSFDFFGVLLNVNPSNLRYSNIVFNSCHIEGLGVSSNSNPTIYETKGLVVNGSTTNPVNVTFNSSHFNFTSYDIGYENIIRGFVNLNIEMIFYYTFSTNYLPVLSTVFLCDSNVKVHKYNVSWIYNYLYIPISNTVNLYRNYNFALNEIGQTNSQINVDNMIKLAGKSGTLNASIVADDTYTKALKIECTSSTDVGIYCTMELGKFLMNSGQRIDASLLFKTNIANTKIFVAPIYYYYYDINDNLIGSTPSGSARPQSNNGRYLHNTDSYVRPSVGMHDTAPVGTYYCIPKLELNGHMDNTEYIYLTNISISIQ